MTKIDRVRCDNILQHCTTYHSYHSCALFRLTANGQITVVRKTIDDDVFSKAHEHKSCAFFPLEVMYFLHAVLLAFITSNMAYKGNQQKRD